MKDGITARNEFGGPWTELKLDAVEYYLQCYLNAMSRTTFKLWYIDAFAGTGKRVRQRLTGGLLEQTPIETIREEVEGSVLRALGLTPPFDHFVFIEKNPIFHAALQQLLNEKVSANITCMLGEANKKLREIISDPRWKARNSGNRGVVFLDPFALQVEWNTLKALGSTQALDVWYLFPLRDVTRQLAKSSQGIGPKAPKLDAVLGPAWSTELYSFPTAEGPPQTSLFPASIEDSGERIGDKSHIERWFKYRLQTIFAHVSEPLPLFTDPSRQAFSLFLAVANPDHSAIDLASKFSKHVNKRFGPASHRTSAR